MNYINIEKVLPIRKISDFEKRGTALKKKKRKKTKKTDVEIKKGKIDLYV